MPPCPSILLSQRAATVQESAGALREEARNGGPYLLQKVACSPFDARLIHARIYAFILQPPLKSIKLT